MSLKIEDVKVGDTLICINKDRFKRKCTTSPIATSENFMVTNVDVYRENIHFEGFLMISASELKYFKKKEQSQQYTFDDLIDVARKAFDDGVISELHQSKNNSHWLRVTTLCGVDVEWCDISCEYEKPIEFIQSLYRETFVIESEEDIKRIKLCAKITLANGNSGIAMVIDKQYKIIQFSEDQKHWGAIGIFILKGATVEQERGRDD